MEPLRQHRLCSKGLMDDDDNDNDSENRIGVVHTPVCLGTHSLPQRLTKSSAHNSLIYPSIFHKSIPDHAMCAVIKMNDTFRNNLIRTKNGDHPQT